MGCFFEKKKKPCVYLYVLKCPRKSFLQCVEGFTDNGSLCSHRIAQPLCVPPNMASHFFLCQAFWCGEPEE